MSGENFDCQVRQRVERSAEDAARSILDENFQDRHNNNKIGDAAKSGFAGVQAEKIERLGDKLSMLSLAEEIGKVADDDNRKSKLHHNHPVSPFEILERKKNESSTSASPPAEIRQSKKF